MAKMFPFLWVHHITGKGHFTKRTLLGLPWHSIRCLLLNASIMLFSRSRWLFPASLGSPFCVRFEGQIFVFQMSVSLNNRVSEAVKLANITVLQDPQVLESTWELNKSLFFEQTSVYGRNMTWCMVQIVETFATTPASRAYKLLHNSLKSVFFLDFFLIFLVPTEG